jgi:uncharacterized membrane protein
MKEQFNQEELNRMRNDPDNYKWGFFIITPTIIGYLYLVEKGIGLSLNWANPYAYLIIFAIMLFAVLVGRF